MGINQIYQQMREAILEFDEEAAVNAATELVELKGDPVQGINVMGDALNELGEQFQRMEVFLPEIILASDALKGAMEILKPELLKVSATAGRRPVVVIGTVQGDVHQVGKDMVATMLMTAGFDVTDLGVDVAPSHFLDEAKRLDADIIAASALMSTTLPVQKDLIDFLEAKKIRGNYKVMVGGGVATEAWAEKIKADGYGQDAIEGVEIAKKLTSKK